MELWQHQRDIINAAVPAKKWAIFAEMGTGKTCTAIQILRAWCGNNKRLLKTLVFTPSAVKRSWQREFYKFSRLGDQTYILDGAKRTDFFKRKAFREQGGPRAAIFVLNYEALQIKDLLTAMMGWEPECIIIDESHRIKDYKAKRTKALIKLSDLADYKLLLTGTPILNSPMDIWAQFRALDGGETFGENFYVFRSRWFYDRNEAMPSHKKFPDWQPLPGLEEEFHKRIYAKATRVLKSECLDLPPMVKERVEIEMSGDQARMYAEMRDEYVTYLNDKACVATLALTKGLRLQQIVSGFFTDDDGNEMAYKTNPRLDALMDLLLDLVPRSKVIVWASFKHNHKQIIRRLEKAQIGYASLVGGMSDKERQEGIDAFQDDKATRVMVANQAAGGVGVTLTAANIMIYYSRNFSLEQDMQSEARCHRGGSEQHDKITRIDLVAPGTIDEIVLESLSNKENLANKILDIKGDL